MFEGVYGEHLIELHDAERRQSLGKLSFFQAGITRPEIPPRRGMFVYADAILDIVGNACYSG